MSPHSEPFAPVQVFETMNFDDDPEIMMIEVPKLEDRQRGQGDSPDSSTKKCKALSPRVTKIWPKEIPEIRCKERAFEKKDRLMPLEKDQEARSGSRLHQTLHFYLLLSSIFGCHFFCVHFHTSYVHLSIYTLG